MTDSIVATRYAQALFSLSSRESADAAERHGACLRDLAEMLVLEPRLDAVLKSPVIGIEEKKAVLGELLKHMDADRTMRNFLFLLADKNRLGSLVAVSAIYGDLLDASKGIRRGTVTTAIRLSPEKQDALRKALIAKVGGEMEVVFKIDPEILGGMVLTVGDKVLDSSLRAQLGILRETLIRGI